MPDSFSRSWMKTSSSCCLRVSMAVPRNVGIECQTKPEQTLSVPVVFRNCLNFNEFVDALFSCSRSTRQGSPAWAPPARTAARTISAVGVAPAAAASMNPALRTAWRPVRRRAPRNVRADIVLAQVVRGHRRAEHRVAQIRGHAGGRQAARPAARGTGARRQGSRPDCRAGRAARGAQSAEHQRLAGPHGDLPEVELHAEAGQHRLDEVVVADRGAAERHDARRRRRRAPGSRSAAIASQSSGAMPRSSTRAAGCAAIAATP